jgi:transcription elongation factor B subunit 1
MEEEVIKLISSDQQEFTLDKRVALGSKTIALMLNSEGQFMETISNQVHFAEIRGEILAQVCRYLEYKHQYAHATGEIPEFAVDPDKAFELLLAADYLDV